MTDTQRERYAHTSSTYKNVICRTWKKLVYWRHSELVKALLSLRSELICMLMNQLVLPAH